MSNERDLATVKNIRKKNITIKSFDFDGEKFVPAACDPVIDQLEKEITTLRATQLENEKPHFLFFTNFIQPIQHSLMHIKNTSALS